MLAAIALVSSQLTPQGQLTSNESCKTTEAIICEEELVKVGTCLTRLSNSSNIAVSGYCPYITNKIDEEILYANFYHINFDVSTLTEQTCAPLNREGLLCSDCYDGYGPAVYAFGNECIKCNWSAYGGWALYLFVVLFPITVFYIIVIVFNVQATAPPLIAFVLYCQILTTTERTKMPTPTRFNSLSSIMLRVARTLAGVWSLDFGRHIIPPFCVSENLNTYHALLLDYISGFYPMLLILITYIGIKLHSNNCKIIVALWSPFHKCFAKVRRTWNPQASIINAFATFLILSFSKVLFISFYSIKTQATVMLNGTFYSKRLYYYPHISANSQHHITVMALSYTLTTVFVYVPILLLCCYPFKYFKKALFCCCSRRRLVADMFMDTFQGYYKDGTNGTYDWRFLSGLYPLLIALTLPTLSRKYHYQTGEVALYFIVCGIFSIVRPYKQLTHNLVDILLLHLTTMMVCYGQDMKWLQRVNYFSDDSSQLAAIIVLVMSPHCVFLLVIVYKAVVLLQHRFDISKPCGLKHTCLSVHKMWRRFTANMNGQSQPGTDQPFVSYGTF